MVNGEITKVEYNGEVYEKVGTPKKGDIGLFTEDSWVSFSEGIPVFTEIIDVDDVGDPLVSPELGSVWLSKYLTYFRKSRSEERRVGKEWKSRWEQEDEEHKEIDRRDKQDNTR